MRKQQIAIFALTLWLFIVTLYMLISNRFDFELFFVLFFIGILIILQFIEPNYVKPGYLRYIRYLIAMGIVIFGIIVAQKVMEILGLEIVL
jgi:hypothetical protein